MLLYDKVIVPKRLQTVHVQYFRLFILDLQAGFVLRTCHFHVSNTNMMCGLFTVLICYAFKLHVTSLYSSACELCVCHVHLINHLCIYLLNPLTPTFAIWDRGIVCQSVRVP